MTVALRAAQTTPWRRAVAPVTVAWQGQRAMVHLRLPTQEASNSIECDLVAEDGELFEWSTEPAESPTTGALVVNGDPHLVKRITVPPGLPAGYHRLTLRTLRRELKTTLMVAPPHLHPGRLRDRTWGAFLPLYALRTRDGLGCGDLRDLAALAGWVGEMGGELVGTLPLLAAFLDEPFEPSPYAPASRLFWNEFYLHLEGAPELARCAAAREILGSADFGREMRELTASSRVDYRRIMSLKRKVMGALAESLDQLPSRRQELESWADRDSRRRDYARFRATGERRRAPWTQWSPGPRDGRLAEDDFEPAAERQHLYAQWLLDDQMTRVARSPDAQVGLYLDLPLGVHPASYDTWRERGAFALEAEAGAPPDSFFAEGQAWGFPPLHPGRLRDDGYHYYIASLRHHLRLARVLRIDHIMGLHRLFWIPAGQDKRDGVYVRYPARELYAILSIESHRHQALLIGEDLGLVPLHVRETMAGHRLPGIYCLPFETRPARPGRPNPVPGSALACLNTHDMEPFASFLTQVDPGTLEALAAHLRDQGLLEERSGTRESPLPRVFSPAGEERAEDLLLACLEYLASSPARILLVNLEDLWLETERQNQPGTGQEEPNWTRKAGHPLEEFRFRPLVLQALNRVRRARPG